MAVTITNPNGFCSFNNPAVFFFTQTDIDTATHRRRFGYQLLKADNTPLTGEEATSGIEGQPVRLDFTNVMRDALSATPTKTTGTHAEAVLLFKLKYWELVFDKDTCSTTIELASETPTFTMLNTTRQWWYTGYNNDITNSVISMVYKPRIKYIVRGELDFIGIFNNTDVNFTYLDSALNPIGDTTESVSSGEAKTIVVNPNSWAANTATVNVFSENKLITTYVLGRRSGDFLPCDSNNNEEVFPIVYQSHQGLYGIMYLGREQLSHSSTNSEFLGTTLVNKDTTNHSQSIVTQGGRKVLNMKTDEQFTVTRYVGAKSLEDLREIEDFLGSQQYYLMMDVGTDVEFVNITPITKRHTYTKAEDTSQITFQFKLANYYQLPSI